MRVRFAIALLLLAAFGLPAKAQEGRERPLTVVELFTAQGCDGCPDANAYAAGLARNPDLIVLTYGVDYWDYLGWEDTFARPEFVERQRAYRAALRQRDIYTPQVVINGHGQAPGVRAEALDTLLGEERGRPRAVIDTRFQNDGQRIAVGSGRAPRGGADVWLVRYQAEVDPVLVRRGENRGVSVPHANVVRELADIGDWRGRAASYDLPEPSVPGLTTVVLVQARATGEILAADRLDP
ncbi:DUF1223 domain-containing protein [Brevundimonas sp. 2R-24]|uniref:DUF1223 domain-containing protein n=1 Tax=Peiella sedimenti TaxID=3061083 RepID=A0ABT8SNN6_9CAUL|nr:DUF1223 domain-containing protein [Caulobacteraceae bacterium XZ-24]